MNRVFSPTAPYHGAVLSALHDKVWSPSWTTESFKNLLTSPAAVGFIALWGEIPIGFILGHCVPPEGEILTFAVDPVYQNQGWGVELLTIFITELKKRKVHKILLEVAVTNIKARFLYEKLGFLQIGHRFNYYTKKDSKQTDALIMSFTVK